ncbi:CPBP family intramembrane glutamic endopeptidase [Duganella sp. HH101]|uniref:CPBP family intramembrane glutamic endopeptidase n=1 Tax=Duganella sp. HH101 TaxID=1781066 RepID=UPI000874E202|nr:type II CAAX endopeptidase family protein [Duganella sp. HH101]OFA06109.1 CAAX amino terminal protease self- immunity [Duganella sp. HH101]
MTQQATQALTPGRAIWLMMKMRLTRQRNMVANNLFSKFRKKQGRNGIGKKSSLWVLTLVMVAFMLFTFFNVSRNVVLNMDCNLSAHSACHVVGKEGERFDDLELAAAELHAAPFRPELARGLTMVVTLLFGIAVLLPLGSKELAQPDWDMEWLVTMPVERSTLLWGRLLERSAANFSGMFALLPPLAVIGWYSGLAWYAPLAALLAMALLLPLAALLHTLADTGLRMWLPASQLRNLQAITGLFSMPLIYFIMALGMPGASGFVMDLARGFPAWTAWTPPGMVLQAMQAPGLGAAVQMAAILLLETAVLMWAGVALMRHQLRHGVVNSGARESVRRKQPAATPSAVDGATSVGLRARLANALSPIKRRELRLLSRDRNFLVQTLLLPVVIVVSQMIFNGKLNSFAELGQHHTTAAAIAFGIGVYVLMLSAFQTLNNEGQVLWLLYTVPRSIESVLKEKAQLWGTLTMIYPLIVIGISAWYTTHFEWRMLALLLIVFTGIPIYSMIAVSLGVFACDPQAVEARARVRPTYVYLYMLLASFYTWSIYSSVWSQKLVVMVLVASMALALWQKARDALPYLLDPAAAPPPRVSTADGLIAATAFFIMQGLITLLIMQGTDTPTLKAATMAFAGAGLLVYVLMRFVYWRSKTGGVPAVLRGGDLAATLRYGALAAAIACAAGLAYMAGLQHTSVWPEIAKQMSASSGTRAWLLALAVVAAPLCEEFIFRGLIYGGLRRSMPAPPAMAMSAAIFAVVHPPVSMLPVFVLGLCTAWTYERSKTLLGPMLVHAAYNAVILSWQFWR